MAISIKWSSRPRRLEGAAAYERPEVAAAENSLSEFLEFYAGRPASSLSFMLRNTSRLIRAYLALVRLPTLVAAPSGTVEGDAVRKALHPDSGWRCWWMPVMAVLPVPDAPAKVGLGARNQTLRRKVRSAERLGMWWKTVDDEHERAELIALTSESERTHANERYRMANPDNSELLLFPLWIAAYSADKRPVLLAVAAVDGEWAWLRYFRTIGSGAEQSDARYLGLYALAGQLAGRGVRYLFDEHGLTWLAPGLRHYQRMVGFRIFRIKVRKAGQARPAAAGVPAGAGQIAAGSRAPAGPRPQRQKQRGQLN